MVRIALLPIVAVAVVCIVAAVAALVAVIAKSPKRKLLALIPIGAVVVLLVVAGALTMVRTSMVHEQAVVERRMRDQVAAEMRAAREEYPLKNPSQVLNYRGDGAPITDPLRPVNATPIEIVSYSPSGAAEGHPLTALPEWVNEPTEFDPHAATQVLVLSSFPKLTVDEADEELYGMLTEYAGEYLSAAYPEASGWEPEREELQEMTLIQEAVTERFPLEVSAGQPVEMQRTHWKVELTPDVRERLFEMWRPTLVQARLVKLGAGLGLLTLLFAIAAGVLRFQGRRPRRSELVASS